MRKLFDRRIFLRGMGATLWLPVLPSILTKEGLAATGKPKRFIAIFTASGQYAPSWYPSSQLTWQQAQKNVRIANLADCSPSISEILGSSFDSMRQKISLVRGLDYVRMDTRDHWPAKMLCGYGNQNEMHVSIDQIMARSPAVYQSEPWMRSMNIIVPGPTDLDPPYSLAYSQVGGTVQAVVPQGDPLSVYQQLFGQTIAGNRGSIVDRVRAQYEALRSNSMLSSDDKNRLDAHVTLIRDLEQRLNAPRQTCDIPAKPNAIGEADIDYPKVTKDHIDLIVSALKCDLTRVVVLQMGAAADARKFTWVPASQEPPDGSGTTVFHGFHAITHEDFSTSAPKTVAIGKWQAEQVAYLLNQLNQVEDAATGRTYLDNSIVYWNSELGAWGDPNARNYHVSSDYPVFLAGDCGGYFRQGRYVDYRSDVPKAWSSYPNGAGNVTSNVGRPINELFITLMSAMGLSPSEWEIGGEAGFGDYSGNYNNQYVIGDKRSPLPGVVA